MWEGVGGASGEVFEEAVECLRLVPFDLRFCCPDARRSWFFFAFYFSFCRSFRGVLMIFFYFLGPFFLLWRGSCFLLMTMFFLSLSFPFFSSFLFSSPRYPYYGGGGGLCSLFPSLFLPFFLRGVDADETFPFYSERGSRQKMTDHPSSSRHHAESASTSVSANDGGSESDGGRAAAAARTSHEDEDEGRGPAKKRHRKNDDALPDWVRREGEEDVEMMMPMYRTPTWGRRPSSSETKRGDVQFGLEEGRRRSRSSRRRLADLDSPHGR
jgi:hypothetical protein